MRTKIRARLLVAMLLICGAVARAADDTGDERFVVIRAGKVITVAGKEIPRGVIVLSDGKIHSVGRGIEYPLNAKVIDARDRVVMPGLINPRTRYGEPAYHRKSVHGNLTVADEHFPRPDAYEGLLDAGYTAIAIYPAGVDIPGRALVTRTAGTDDARTLKSPSYLRVIANKPMLRGALEKAKKEIEKVEKARKDFEKKQAEEKKKQEAAKKQPPESQPAKKPESKPAKPPAFKPPPINPAYQALVDLIQEKPNVFALLELSRASDYVHMRDVLEQFEIAHHYYARNTTQSDFEYVVEQMGERGEKVILTPRIGIVPYSVERIHLVRMFTDAGCEVSFVPRSDSGSEHRRILGRIAELVREGWSREAALKSVTLHPARLLGLDKRLGTIEKDKDADLIFLDADPLDPTARVREVMIAGEIVHRVEDFE